MLDKRGNCFIGKTFAKAYPNHEFHVIHREYFEQYVIKIYDAESDSRVIYNAKARSKNPLSDESEVEHGVMKAMEKLKKEIE